MKTKCIFIIEDNKVFRKITKQVLEEHCGARVISFQSAEEAMTQIDLYDPDIILLDYVLSSRNPGNMNGLEFLQKNAALERKRMVIVMSGQEDRKVTTSLLKSGAVNYLQKDGEDFFQKLVVEIQRASKVIDLKRSSRKHRYGLRSGLFRISVFVLLPILMIWIVIFSL